MKPNVGSKERYVRIGIGLLSGVVALTLVKSRKTSLLLGMAAASGIETGLSRYCLINEVLGIDNAKSLQETPIRPLL